MERDIELIKELEELKKNPHQIDFFAKVIVRQIGENETIEILNQALEFYKQGEENTTYLKLLILKIEIELVYGNLNEAAQSGEEAEGIIKSCKVEDINLYTQLYHKLLEVYMKKGCFKQAIHYMKQAMEALKQCKDPVLHRKIMLSTARLYLMIEDDLRAKEVLNQLEAMSNWLSPKEILEMNMLFLELCLKQEEIEKAIAYSLKAYDLISSIEDEKSYDSLKSEVFRLRAVLQSKRNLMMQTEKDFKSAEKYSQGYKENQAKTLMSLGAYLLSEDKISEAEQKIEQASELIQAMGSKYYEKKLNEVRLSLYEKTQNWEKAYPLLKQLTEEKYEKTLRNHQIDEEMKEVVEEKINSYEEDYNEIQKLSKLGKIFTAKSLEEDIKEIVEDGIKRVIDLDMIGLGVLEEGKIAYHIYDLKEGWLSLDNDLVKYASRLADYSVQYEVDLLVNDGNFEEYSLKHIVNSETGVPLQSMMVKTLKVGHQVIGAVTLGSYKLQAYSIKDTEVASIIASYLAMALKHQQLDKKLENLLQQDPLTGMLLRRAVLKHGEQVFKANHKKRKHTTVMMLEVDFLKKINDKYGYELGDEVLIKVAQLIKENIRAQDYAGRYDGAKFIIILNDLASKEVTHIASRIKEAIEQITFETKRGQSMKVSLSGGIYICDEYTLNFEEALRFADHALYRANLMGRNCMMSYSLTNHK